MTPVAAATDRHCAVLGHLLAEHLDLPREGKPDRWHVGIDARPVSGGVDPDLHGAILVELHSVVGDELTRRMRGGADRHQLGEWIAQRLAHPSADHSRSALWLLVGGDDRGDGAAVVRAVGRREPSTSRRWVTRRSEWLERQAAATLMNVIIAGTVTVAWLLWWLGHGAEMTWPTLALKGFALWCLAFLPCWLYVRFLGQRAGAVWDEYVLNLHRLGWDEPRFLPRPMRSSTFYEEWADDGGRTQMQDRNIYRQKFNAYYGRSVSDTATGNDFRVRLDTLFPVFLMTAVLAVGWTAVLWDDAFLGDPTTVGDVLKFGFLGAYVFIAQMLLRRFFASDLRPSAYTSALLRIVVVLLSVAAVYQLLQIWLSGDPNITRWEALTAFAIGFLPLMASQVIIRAVSVPLRITTRSFEADYPLDQIDGLNIWYQAQLAEENIDDMQTLATANIVDVLLHTRVPVGRLVDWVDQALLFLHLDRVERGFRELRKASKGDVSTDASTQLVDAVTGSSVSTTSRGGTRTRTILRQHGIRTATDLLTAFPPGTPEPAACASVDRISHGDEILAEQIRVLVRVLGEDPALAPVWNWRDRGVRARCAQRRPRGCVQAA